MEANARQLSAKIDTAIPAPPVLQTRHAWDCGCAYRHRQARRGQNEKARPGALVHGAVVDKGDAAVGQNETRMPTPDDFARAQPRRCCLAANEKTGGLLRSASRGDEAAFEANFAADFHGVHRSVGGMIPDLRARATVRKARFRSGRTRRGGNIPGAR